MPEPLPYHAAPMVPPQLAPEHLAQLQLAGRAMRKVRRAVFTASVDGWSVGVFGAITAIAGLMDPPSLALGLVMVGVAIVELRTAARLRRLDVAAPRILAWNQVALGTALFVYASIRLIAVARGGHSEFAAMIQQDPQMGDMLNGVEDLTREVLMLVYACVMAVAIFGQGSMAIYYATRARHVRAYVDQTPPWILDMQRAGVSV